MASIGRGRDGDILAIRCPGFQPSRVRVIGVRGFAHGIGPKGRIATKHGKAPTCFRKRIGQPISKKKAGVSSAEFDDLVTDEMVDAIFIAGTPGDCLERMIEVQDTAREQGFHQLMYSELGPDVGQALGLLCDEIIPAL